MRALTVLVMLFALAGCASAPKAVPPGQRVEEARYLTVGGIEQWVTIRGDDDRKPMVLLLHGGPGDVQSMFVDAYKPYEHDFVLVQWDQRGGGRTYQKLLEKTPDLTLERQIDDGIELAGLLRAKFPGRRLILLGHSWGTIIGTGMAQKRPDLFDAYVGAGQVASWAAVVNRQYDVILAASRETGDTATVARLVAMGRPDPTNIPQYFSIAPLVRVNQPAADKAWLAGTRTAPGITPADSANAGAGMNYSGGKLIETLVRVDLTKTASSFPIPWFVIQGRDDLNTPTDAARTYFERVEAPKKQFAVIEGAGHFALATHADQFVTLMKAMLK